MDREKFGDLTGRMNRAAQRQAKVRRGWRDYVGMLGMNKTRWCTLVFLAGVTVAGLSGRVFMDRFKDILDRTWAVQNLPYDGLDARIERASKSREVE